MSRRTFQDWFVACQRRNGRGRKQCRVASPHRRPLRFEPLEDRRLLSITVNTLADENDGIAVGGISLRDAIAAATSGETIDFSVTGTILLENGELAIDKPLTVIGPGASLLTIDASGNDPTPALKNGDGSRVLLVSDGSFGTPIDVEISGLTLTSGDGGGDGGGIENHENLHLADSTILGNAAAGNGGGIFHTGGMLTLSTVVVRDNRAQEGGGLYNIGDVAHVFNSDISRNRQSVAVAESSIRSTARFSSVPAHSRTIRRRTAARS